MTNPDKNEYEVPELPWFT